MYKISANNEIYLKYCITYVPESIWYMKENVLHSGVMCMSTRKDGFINGI